MLLLTLLLAAAGCSSPGAVVTFREADDPTADTLADWTAVTPGLNVSWCSVDERYPRSVAPQLDSTRCRLTAWRGERCSAQLLLWSPDSVGAVRCTIGRFRGRGTSLPANVARLRFVRYVLTDEFGPGCGYRNDGDFAASLSPDLLDTLDRFDLESCTTRPVWVTLDIPADAVPGLYRTTLTVEGQGVARRRLELDLQVLDRQLPPPEAWRFHLDLWQHPAAVARVEGVELWSDAHFKALRPLVRMLADAGQKVVTATLNRDPWNHQCYDAYDPMILWSRRADGTWHYDYTRFDRWVTLCREEGIVGAINCYSLLPWNNLLEYRDEAKGALCEVEADPATPRFEEYWTPFLHDFTAHLDERGWLGLCNVAMDERDPETMERAVALLRREAPELGIALADNHASYRRYEDLEDVCVQIDCRVEASELARRRSEGLVTTFYVCCSSAFPNTFTFSRPWEALYMGWFAAAAGYDGMLRWAYNSWPADPQRDSRFTAWPAGDTFIVYPEARSSVRFEQLREGIEDYEKIDLLRRELMADPSAEAAACLDELNRTVAQFAEPDPARPWTELLARARALLDSLAAR